MSLLFLLSYHILNKSIISHIFSKYITTNSYKFVHLQKKAERNFFNDIIFINKHRYYSIIILYICNLNTIHLVYKSKNNKPYTYKKLYYFRMFKDSKIF